MAEALLILCKDKGIDVILTSTYRDKESQDALYAQGRTTPGKKVTNAKGGQSMHNWRVAFDVVPVINGKAVWNDDNLWNRVGEIGESVGLEWGGRWSKFIDKPHLQFTQGLTLADFNAGKMII
jgi:peptidoglycan L-alanyl-D-glutamate endopeptidase CwlK